MIPEQKAILERAKQPETSTVRELMDERDEYKSGAKNACIGLSVAVAEIATLTARNAELMDENAKLNARLRTVQNAAKTLASAQNTELQHRRQNAAFDHKLRAEHESLLERDALMTEQVSTLTAQIDALHLMQELGEDLAWRSYLGIQVLQTVLKKSKLEAGADVSAKLLTDIAIQYPHFPAKSALRPMPTRRELENKP